MKDALRSGVNISLIETLQRLLASGIYFVIQTGGKLSFK
jgi:hypothetical protein